MHTVIYLSVSWITMALPLSADLIVIESFVISSFNAACSDLDRLLYVLDSFMYRKSIVVLVKKVSMEGETPFGGVQPLDS